MVLTNKVLLGICLILLPIAIIGSYSFGKAKMPKPQPSIYDNLVETSVDEIAPNPLNPNSKAEVVIEAPTEASVGQLVRFNLSKSSGTMFKWCVIPATPNFEFFDGGKKACFSADKAGSYTFVVACAYGNTVDVKTHVLKVTNSTPTPGPNPPEPPKPDPPKPDNTISGKVKIWMEAITTPTKNTEAIKLANSFDSVASMIVGGGVTEPEDIIAKTAEANRAALGTQLASWVPFLTNLQGEMKERATAGVLVTPEQHAQLWKEIAIALREVAGPPVPTKSK